jgi:hypothetical protein
MARTSAWTFEKGRLRLSNTVSLGLELGGAVEDLVGGLGPREGLAAVVRRPWPPAAGCDLSR